VHRSINRSVSFDYECQGILFGALKPLGIKAMMDFSRRQPSGCGETGRVLCISKGDPDMCPSAFAPKSRKRRCFYAASDQAGATDNGPGAGVPYSENYSALTC